MNSTCVRTLITDEVLPFTQCTLEKKHLSQLHTSASVHLYSFSNQSCRSFCHFLQSAHHIGLHIFCRSEPVPLERAFDLRKQLVINWNKIWKNTEAKGRTKTLCEIFVQQCRMRLRVYTIRHESKAEKLPIQHGSGRKVRLISDYWYIKFIICL